MDKSEVKKLWALLGELYPRQKQQATAERLGAWALALEPYSYDEIRGAALAHARSNEYYPSIAELTVRLPKPEAAEECKNSGALWQAYIDRHCTEQDTFSVSRYAREHGMTWHEAQAEARFLGLIEEATA